MDWLIDEYGKERESVCVYMRQRAREADWGGGGGIEEEIGRDGWIWPSRVNTRELRPVTLSCWIAIQKTPVTI